MSWDNRRDRFPTRDADLGLSLLELLRGSRLIGVLFLHQYDSRAGLSSQKSFQMKRRERVLAMDTT